MRLLIFMLHFIFILLVVLACGQNEPEAQNGKEVEENVLLPTEGYVRSNGQGIAGVVVTDGKDLGHGKQNRPYFHNYPIKRSEKNTHKSGEPV